MKKKYRDITVNNKNYAWAVTNHNCDGDGGIVVKIWHNKEIIFQKFLTASEKPDSITPKYIRKIIEKES
jgi:hypothetical protein